MEVEMVLVLLIPMLFFIWNIVLTIMMCRLYSKKKAKVICNRCGSVQISAIRQNANDGYGIINVCQNCGNTWEIVK